MNDALKFLPQDSAVVHSFDKDMAKHEREQQREAHEHEREIQYTEFQHETELKKIDNNQQIKQTNKKIGWIGIIFGDENHSSRNITAIICIFSIIMSWCVLFADNPITEENSIFVKEIMFPIITLSLGYLFGKSSNNTPKS